MIKEKDMHPVHFCPSKNRPARPMPDAHARIARIDFERINSPHPRLQAVVHRHVAGRGAGVEAVAYKQMLLRHPALFKPADADCLLDVLLMPDLHENAGTKLNQDNASALLWHICRIYPEAVTPAQIARALKVLTHTLDCERDGAKHLFNALESLAIRPGNRLSVTHMDALEYLKAEEPAWADKIEVVLESMAQRLLNLPPSIFKARPA